jgi:hypothetical protein
MPSKLTDTFNKWFDYFVHWPKMSAQDSVLLTADSHIHTPKNNDVTDIATEHGVATINLPTHPTQKKYSHSMLVSWRSSKHITHKRLKRG